MLMLMSGSTTEIAHHAEPDIGNLLSAQHVADMRKELLRQLLRRLRSRLCKRLSHLHVLLLLRSKALLAAQLLRIGRLEVPAVRLCRRHLLRRLLSYTPGQNPHHLE